MAKKFNAKDHIPDFEDDLECSNCPKVGATQYDNGEALPSMYL